MLSCLLRVCLFFSSCSLDILCCSFVSQLKLIQLSFELIKKISLRIQPRSKREKKNTLPLLRSLSLKSSKAEKQKNYSIIFQKQNYPFPFFLTNFFGCLGCKVTRLHFSPLLTIQYCCHVAHAIVKD